MPLIKLNPEKNLGGWMAIPLILICLSSASAMNSSGFRDPGSIIACLFQTGEILDGDKKIFMEGRVLLSDKEWGAAEEKFKEVINRFPKSENIDAAHYWLAFALKKQNKLLEADKFLGQLINGYHGSNWLDDALALRVEIAPYLGKRLFVITESRRAVNDEINIAALQSLFVTNPDEATLRVSKLLKQESNIDRTFKESLITLLGQSSIESKDKVLTDLAKSLDDPRLRNKALYYLHQLEQENQLRTVLELAEKLEDLETAEMVQSLLNKRAGDEAWLIIKDGGQALELPKGNTVRIDGVGKLSINVGDRIIKLPAGITVTVDGKPISSRYTVRGKERVQLLENGTAIWELSHSSIHLPIREGVGWAGKAEISFFNTEPETYIIQYTPDGRLQARMFSGAADFGIKTEAISEAMAAHLNLQPGQAILVTDIIETGLAYRSGLRKHDVITEIDGNPSFIYSSLQRALQNKNAGEKILFRGLRRSESFDITMELPHTSRANSLSMSGQKLENAGHKYSLSYGPDSKIKISNFNGDLEIENNDEQLIVKLNGKEVPKDRIVYHTDDGPMVEVRGENDETLFMFGLYEDGTLVYTEDFDPYTSQGRIGLSTSPVDESLAEQLNLKSDEILLVNNVVKDSPADKAGLRKFDIITHINGAGAVKEDDLSRVARLTNPGDAVSLTVLRNGRREGVIITLDPQEWPDRNYVGKFYNGVFFSSGSFPLSNRRLKKMMQDQKR